VLSKIEHSGKTSPKQYYTKSANQQLVMKVYAHNSSVNSTFEKEQ